VDDFLTFVPRQAIETPCVNICRVERGRCIGCKRTVDEIARWTSMDAKERAAVMADLGERQA
jgi:uncharacterized protein